VGDEAMSYQDLIGRQQAAGFVGREGPLAQFQANLVVPVGDRARRLVFFIHGDGGVGKTSLVMRLREIARRHGSLTAYLDESVFSVPEAMNTIAVDLGRQGEPMKRFTRLFTKYRQRRHEVETDRNLPQGAATFLTSTAVRVGLHAAHAVPGVGGLADVVDGKAAARSAERCSRSSGRDEDVLRHHVRRPRRPPRFRGVPQVPARGRHLGGVAADRLGRSMRHIVNTLHELTERGITVKSIHDGIDTLAATGRMMAGILASLAQYERELIKERTRPQARARPPIRREVRSALKLNADQAALARRMKASDETAATICRTLGIGRTTLYRYLAESVED